MVERFAVLGAMKEESRVRRYVERGRLQAIELKVHGSLLTETADKER
jgi:hypothetical protein